MMPKYDVQIILVRTYGGVEADSPDEAMGKGKAWAEGWAKREEGKDGKTLKVVGAQTLYWKTADGAPQEIEIVKRPP